MFCAIKGLSQIVNVFELALFYILGGMTCEKRS